MRKRTEGAEQFASKLDGFGISDEDARLLLGIRTQTEFAEKFSVKDLGTLTDWNKKIEAEGLEEKMRPKWTRKLTKNVIAGLYRNAVAKGMAAEAKLWLQYVEGWVEESKFGISGLSEEIVEIGKSIRGILGGLKKK